MTTPAPAEAIPEKLQSIMTMFKSMPKTMRLQALLEYSKGLPNPPQKYLDHPEFMKPVPECTSPFFLITEREMQGENEVVRIHFKVPEEAPTVRGYAGILKESLDGESAENILAVPDQFYMDMGLSELITPMRMRGMGAILMRLKRELQQEPVQGEPA